MTRSEVDAYGNATTVSRSVQRGYVISSRTLFRVHTVHTDVGIALLSSTPKVSYTSIGELADVNTYVIFLLCSRPNYPIQKRNTVKKNQPHELCYRSNNSKSLHLFRKKLPDTVIRTKKDFSCSPLLY